MSDKLSKYPNARNPSRSVKASRITIGVWESNETTPSIEQVFAIAKITGVDPFWIVTGAGDQTSPAAGTIEIGMAAITPDDELEFIGSAVIAPSYFEHYQGDVSNLAGIHYDHGQCHFGNIDWIFFDPTDVDPSVAKESFLYIMSPGACAMAEIRKVGPKNGKERVHIFNSDLMIDDTVFLDEVKILGKVVRWCGH